MIVVFRGISFLYCKKRNLHLFKMVRDVKSKENTEVRMNLKLPTQHHVYCAHIKDYVHML